MNIFFKGKYIYWEKIECDKGMISTFSIYRDKGCMLGFGVVEVYLIVGLNDFVIVIIVRLIYCDVYFFRYR